MSQLNEAIDYFVTKWEGTMGGKYNFVRGKDAAALNKLLSLYGADTLKQLVDQFFVSTDEWINTTCRSIGVFAVCTNKLMKEKQRQGLHLSKKGHHNLTAASRWLQNRGNNESDRGQTGVRSDVDKTGGGVPTRVGRIDDRCVLRGTEPLRIEQTIKGLLSDNE